MVTRTTKPAVVLAALVLALAAAVTALALTAGAGSGPGPGRGVMNRGGAAGPGAGMMGGPAGTPGPGMMGGPSGGSAGPGMMGGAYLAGDGRPVRSPAAARARAQVFAGRLGLRVGEVMQFTENYYAELRTPAGKNATEVLVDPADGAVRIEYGPAMMWNTAYGMHPWGATSTARISAAQARRIADDWLRQNQPGRSAGTADAFPGYYTLHTLAGGKVDGMLSVNAATGAVWYHGWHGRFITMTDR